METQAELQADSVLKYIEVLVRCARLLRQSNFLDKEYIGSILRLGVVQMQSNIKTRLKSLNEQEQELNRLKGGPIGLSLQLQNLGDLLKHRISFQEPKVCLYYHSLGSTEVSKETVALQLLTEKFKQKSFRLSDFITYQFYLRKVIGRVYQWVKEHKPHERFCQVQNELTIVDLLISILQMNALIIEHNNDWSVFAKNSHAREISTHPLVMTPQTFEQMIRKLKTLGF